MPLSFRAFEDYIKDKYDNPEAYIIMKRCSQVISQTSIDNSHLIECNSTDVGTSSF